MPVEFISAALSKVPPRLSWLSSCMTRSSRTWAAPRPPWKTGISSAAHPRLAMRSWSSSSSKARWTSSAAVDPLGSSNSFTTWCGRSCCRRRSQFGRVMRRADTLCSPKFANVGCKPSGHFPLLRPRKRRGPALPSRKQAASELSGKHEQRYLPGCAATCQRLLGELLRSFLRYTRVLGTQQEVEALSQLERALHSVGNLLNQGVQESNDGKVREELSRYGTYLLRLRRELATMQDLAIDCRVRLSTRQKHLDAAQAWCDASQATH